MGHAFQHTLMDALTRYQRMRGADALWQPGTDHAGIATQMVVERQLNAAGQQAHRADARTLRRARVAVEGSSPAARIAAQMRRLGDSVDWSRDRFTMDPGLSRAVIEVFVRLHAEGLIYRGKRLVNWDPVLLTALSDLEVQSRGGGRSPLAPALSAGGRRGPRRRRHHAPGNHARATPRSPCIPRMSATAISSAGMLRLPLTERDIPVIADDYVDPAFGSGCVKITPAHDFNDYEIGQRHDLPLINILTPRAAMNDNVPARFRGLDRFEARKRIVAELRAARAARAHRASIASSCRAATAAARCSSRISPTSGT